MTATHAVVEMTAAHAEYAPSSMYLTVACPGWQRQAAGRTSPPNETTLEGEAGHEVAAFTAAVGAVSFIPGGNASNGVAITDEMVDGAAVWLEALEGYPARIETPVQIRRIHPTKCWGTPDARQWNAERLLLRLADYKFGHEFVDEFENWQLLAYAVGTLDEIFPGGEWMEIPHITAEHTVVQPRYYNAAPIRTWAIQTAGLTHYAERMRTAVLEAESANPRLISGTHCTHCPARVDCPTFGKSVMHAVDFTGRPDPMVTTPEAVGRELALVQEFIKRLEARETGLESVAESLIRGGQRVPFYSMQPTVGRLVWTVPLEVVEMSAKQVGKSALAPPKLVTPTQAKDRKLLDTRVIEAYSDRPTGAMKLTRDTHTTARKFST
jgi:hypothetical protein